ncbi:Stealth CR1 domain-containing protein [Providencia huaxiensis]|uniref:Stealth CR1 domain-containing protein n=1 Tax=Providencia huaxiensis TaxID=2027290 RepID=UPI0032DBAA00
MTSDIDVIILWVDSNDPVWINNYNYYSPNKKLEDKRFKDWGTIKYVFRGIEKFLPWVRKIHFVTCGQRPKWMIEKHSKIQFVNHDDIFPDRNILPVFNSSAIELNFNRIPDLAEKFIYFNDDTLVLKKTPTTRFFRENLPVDFLIETLPKNGWLYKKIRKPDNWNNMINNSISLINKTNPKRKLNNKKKVLFSKNYKLSQIIINLLAQSYPIYTGFKHYHHPQAYLKKTIESVNDKYSKDVLETIATRFRSEKNISQAIYRYYHLSRGEFYPSYYNDHSCINIKSLKTALICKEKIKTKRFVCVNDSISVEHPDYDECKNIIINAIDEILPEISSFEIEYYKK